VKLVGQIFAFLPRSYSDGSESKIFDPGQVGSVFCGSGRVSHLWFGLESGKFPLKILNFSIFFPSGQKNTLRVGLKSTRVKGRSAIYLLRVKSKLSLGQRPSLLGVEIIELKCK